MQDVEIETYPVTTVTTESNLVLRNVSDAHTGNYMCREVLQGDNSQR